MGWEKGGGLGRKGCMWPAKVASHKWPSCRLYIHTYSTDEIDVAIASSENFQIHTSYSVGALANTDV